MSRVVGDDCVECRQCHMPFPNSATFMTDKKTDNDENSVDVSVLELEDAGEVNIVSKDEPVRAWKKNWKENK